MTGPNPANDAIYAATYRAMREIMKGDGERPTAEDMIGRAAWLVALADAVRADPGEWSHAEVLALAAECGERTSREPSEEARALALARVLGFEPATFGAPEREPDGGDGPEGEAGS